MSERNVAIPEAQFTTWSHQGSVSQSSDTYNAVKSTLSASHTPYGSKNYEVFLQGSYGNDTNIWTESDVDVVIRIDDVFYSDLSRLAAGEKASFDRAYETATYTYADFERDVLKVLTDKYGVSVTSGDKAITIAAQGNRRKADVIVAAQFRRYFKFNGTYDQTYAEGICFWNKSGTRIENYPKQHAINLTNKHQASSNWLKPVIRVLKNVRSKCVSDGLLQVGTAPSYYLEGLLYNVPSNSFTTSFQDCFSNAFSWIQQADKEELLCANEQFYLLRDGYATCWPRADGKAFIEAATKLWNEW